MQDTPSQDTPHILSQLDGCMNQLVGTLHPTKIVLFGSYAKGTANADSDIDILLVLHQGFTAELTRMSAIRQARQILRPIHCPKDVLVFNNAEVLEWIDSPNHIIGQAFQEGIMLYEQP